MSGPCAKRSLSRIPGLVDLAGRAGVVRLIINGSFVTDVIEPQDVDCVLLVGDGFPQDPAAEAELIAGLPFLELSMVSPSDFNVGLQDARQ